VLALPAGHITCSFSPGEKVRMRGKGALQHIADSGLVCVHASQMVEG
jgi:hypothetical protein